MGRTFLPAPRVRGVLAALLATASLTALAASPAYAQETATVDAVANYDIPAQSLASALVEFARQTQLPVLFDQSETANLTPRPLHGRLAANDALAQLLPHNAPAMHISDGRIVLSERARPQDDAADTSTSEEVVVTGTRIH